MGDGGCSILFTKGLSKPCSVFVFGLFWFFHEGSWCLVIFISRFSETALTVCVTFAQTFPNKIPSVIFHKDNENFEIFGWWRNLMIVKSYLKGQWRGVLTLEDSMGTCHPQNPPFQAIFFTLETHHFKPFSSSKDPTSTFWQILHF